MIIFNLRKILDSHYSRLLFLCFLCLILAREDNVFQADEDLPLPIEMLEIEENSNSSNGENCVKTSHDKNFKCSECPMIFTSSGSLRSHTRHTHKPPEDTLLFCPVCKTAVLHGLENLKLHLYKRSSSSHVFTIAVRIYEFLSRNFLCFVILQDKSFLLR